MTDEKAAYEHVRNPSIIEHIRWRLSSARCDTCRVRVLRSALIDYQTMYGPVRWCRRCWKAAGGVR